MPKSKRDRKSALTQVKKKTRAVKDALISKMRTAVEELPYVYVFHVTNMKNTAMKNVREEWPRSKFFLGKNKVMQLALGKTPSDELRPGLSKLASEVTGSRGVLVTDRTEKEVIQAFADISEMNYARSGFKCTGNYKLAAGTLPADRCPHPMEPMLRRLGLPTKLVQGRVELLSDVNVCAKGDILTPEQCKILQIFGLKLAEFKMSPLYMYHNGAVKELPDAAVIAALEAGEEDEDDQADEEFIELRTAGGEFEGYFGGEAEEMEEANEDEDEDME